MFSSWFLFFFPSMLFGLIIFLLLPFAVPLCVSLFCFKVHKRGISHFRRLLPRCGPPLRSPVVVPCCGSPLCFVARCLSSVLRCTSPASPQAWSCVPPVVVSRCSSPSFSGHGPLDRISFSICIFWFLLVSLFRFLLICFLHIFNHVSNFLWWGATLVFLVPLMRFSVGPAALIPPSILTIYLTQHNSRWHWNSPVSLLRICIVSSSCTWYNSSQLFEDLGALGLAATQHKTSR